MKPNHLRAQFAKWFLYLYGAATIVLIVTEFQELRLVDDVAHGRVTLTQARSNPLNLFHLLVYLFRTLTYFGTVITFILWFYRAYDNLRFIPGARPRFSPGWAAGCWFVPFLNLGRPYRMMKELMADSQVALERAGLLPTTKNRVAVVGWWWAFYLICFFFGTIVSYTVTFATNAPKPKLATIICVEIALLVPLFLAIRMLTIYHRMEVLLPESGPSEFSESQLLDS